VTTRTITVTVSNPGSGNKYFLDGAQQATVVLAEGGTYVFDQADSSNSGHPLRFSTTSDGTHNSGSEYTTGVTTSGTPGNAGAKTTIQVASSAPVLYYYCTNHSGMGGTANTEAATTWGLLSWDEGSWGAQNSIGFAVTGVSSTTAIGSVTIDAEIGEGWGRGTWGNRVWDGVYSVIPTGVSATSAIGTAVASVSHTVIINASGMGLQSNTEDVTTTQGVEIAQTGLPLLSSAGTVDFEGDVTVVPTGVEGTARTNDVVIAPKLNVPVTGVSATSAIGSITLSITGTTSVTGVATTSAVGSITPISGYDVTGVSLTSAVGSPTEITGTCLVDDVTGVVLTSNVGSVIIIAWSEINTGAQTTWTEITTAA